MQRRLQVRVCARPRSPRWSAPWTGTAALPPLLVVKFLPRLQICQVRALQLCLLSAALLSLLTLVNVGFAQKSITRRRTHTTIIGLLPWARDLSSFLYFSELKTHDLDTSYADYPCIYTRTARTHLVIFGLQLAMTPNPTWTNTLKLT